MKEEDLREIAIDYLLPFFSGAWIEEKSIISSSRDKDVSWIGPRSIAFKVDDSDKYRLVICRTQPFSQQGKIAISEIKVIRSFISVVRNVHQHLSGEIRDDILSTFQRRVVARSLVSNKEEKVILKGIDWLGRWGSRLYEGAPVSSSLGFGNAATSSGIYLDEMARNDFCYVLSNGHDTLLEFNFKGKLVGHRALSSGGGVSGYAPFRQLSVANWTEGNSNISMTLNRLGEILIFRGGQLLFTRRSGRWHFLTHDPVVKQMSPPRDSVVRQAIYETCLDASFARTGACIGVVNFENRGADVAAEDDVISTGKSTKSRAIKSIVGGREFQHLDRRLRQEIVAMDGATILSRSGEIICAGAIINVPGGSAGGGRRAAARRISRYGIGIKVSQDGGIEAFRGDKDVPVFKVM